LSKEQLAIKQSWSYQKLKIYFKFLRFILPLYTYTALKPHKDAYCSFGILSYRPRQKTKVVIKKVLNSFINRNIAMNK